ncbi:phage replisome organizer N-terminal domain-containing protein [Clostridium intestinale]|uniref:Phage replisome organizer N-terminal domain-containing protein n=1 Tax=Clostridium intestinale TaxID=36845 RepID=A0A7D6VSF5_9CLOT|nr:phage replisome organizer N-terminal domain-containing protein [Clostridium intestinale]QLY81206.1 phage replisome organizer N-terminal domain-containing protein [Clostridium intestinale]
MADNKKYYYLKLKDNFFDSEEIKILESLPNGIYYSNLLIKLYLKSLKFDGALRFNDFIPYDENMIATITNLNIDTVKSGLNILNSMKLIERLDDGTMYMMNIQSFIGKSSSEADRKRLYRERIEEEKNLIGQGKKEKYGQMSQKSPKDVSENTGTFLDKHSPEREIENRDKELEFRERDRDNIESLSKDLVKYFKSISGEDVEIPTSVFKESIEDHGFKHVKMAIYTAVYRNKPTITYINGILRNWAKEGYPVKEEGDSNGSISENNGTSSKEEYKLKKQGGRALTERERNEISKEVL